MPKSNYIELRNALVEYLGCGMSIPVTVHSGSFSLYELENLHLIEGDQGLLALNAADEEKAQFSLFLKLGNDSEYSSDTKALGFLQQAQIELRCWKCPMIAKRIHTHWQLLPDNNLAQKNCYVYKMDITVNIYDEDYLEDQDDTI